MTLQQSFLLCGILSISALNTSCEKKEETKVYSVEKAAPEPSGPAPQADKDVTAMPPGHPGVGAGESSPSGGMPAAMPPGHPSIGGTSGPQAGGMTGAMPPGHPNIGGAGESAAPSGGPEIDLGSPSPKWEAKPPTSMRLASFVVKGENGAEADISLILLGGGAGGVLDNVNRWQSQLGQPPLSSDELAKKSQSLPTSLGQMTVVDLQGLPNGADAKKDGRIIAAMASKGDMTVFFKLRGNAELAGTQKDDFIKWVGSVRFGAPEATPETKPSPAAAPAPTSGEAAGMNVSPK